MSSTRWLDRQLNDPYASGSETWALTASFFKLLQLMIGSASYGHRIVDLGAAPGGLTQVAVERTKPQESGGKVIVTDVEILSLIAGQRIWLWIFVMLKRPKS